MAFVRTVGLIVLLMAAWFAIRAESAAHSMPPPAARLYADP